MSISGATAPEGDCITVPFNYEDYCRKIAERKMSSPKRTVAWPSKGCHASTQQRIKVERVGTTEETENAVKTIKRERLPSPLSLNDPLFPESDPKETTPSPGNNITSMRPAYRKRSVGSGVQDAGDRDKHHARSDGPKTKRRLTTDRDLDKAKTSTPTTRPPPTSPGTTTPSPPPKKCILLDPSESRPPENLEELREMLSRQREPSDALPASKYQDYVAEVQGACNKPTLLYCACLPLLRAYKQSSDSHYAMVVSHPFTGVPDLGLDDASDGPENKSHDIAQPDVVEGLEVDAFRPMDVRRALASAVLYRDIPQSVTLSHLVGEFGEPGRDDLAVAQQKAARDGATLVHARGEALAYMGKSDRPGDAHVVSFVGNGSLLVFYAHYATHSSNTRTVYHQYPIRSVDLTGSYKSFLRGTRSLRNAQDHGFRAASKLRDRLTTHWQREHAPPSKPSKPKAKTAILPEDEQKKMKAPAAKASSPKTPPQETSRTGMASLSVRARLDSSVPVKTSCVKRRRDDNAHGDTLPPLLKKAKTAPAPVYTPPSPSSPAAPSQPLKPRGTRGIAVKCKAWNVTSTSKASAVDACAWARELNRPAKKVSNAEASKPETSKPETSKLATRPTTVKSSVSRPAPGPATTKPSVSRHTVNSTERAVAPKPKTTAASIRTPTTPPREESPPMPRPSLEKRKTDAAPPAPYTESTSSKPVLRTPPCTPPPPSRFRAAGNAHFAAYSPPLPAASTAPTAVPRGRDADGKYRRKRTGTHARMSPTRRLSSPGLAYRPRSEAGRRPSKDVVVKREPMDS